MNPSDMQVGKVELAARALDLTSALLHAASSSSIVLKGAWEIGQWLGREKLNQYELLDCMERAKGVAFANKNGRELFDQLISGLDTQQVGPLFLQQSGSLGRLMAGDPKLSWMVSTTASLFQHHRNDQLVTDKLTAFIMESHRAREQGAAGGVSSATDALIYSPEQTKVRAVVRKIVSSVWYNVVNAGCDTVPLPQELLDLCQRGHYLDPADFGVVTSTIQARCPSKAILRTDHLLRDVVLWLLLHYDGTIVVTAGGQIIYRASFGNPQRELEVHVTSTCTQDGACGKHGRESYKILHQISGKLDELLSGLSFSEFADLPSQPGIRQKLYNIPRLYPVDSAMWNKGQQINMKCAAQLTMRWLLGVQLSAQEGFSSVGFSATLQGDKPSDPGQIITISHILKKIPAMVSLKWGSSATFPVVFADVATPSSSSSSGSHRRHLPGESAWDIERQLLVLLEYLPVLSDVAKKISADCLCPGCSEAINDSNTPTRPVGLRAGCLQRAALEEVLLLLAHGIADGFGASDAASFLDAAPIIQGMVVLLLELVTERMVCWDTWFAVASCTYLGCPFVRPTSPLHPAFGGTAFAAFQFGNLATQAPWLDLTQEITVRGCFGMIGLRGRLGVVTESENQQHAQFRAIEENFAIVETENTEDTTAFCSRHPKEEASIITDHCPLAEDESNLDSDVVLCQTDDRFYRLLLRVRAQNHWRVVDPSDALSAVIRMLPPAAPCQHEQHEEGPPARRNDSLARARMYTMDEVLGRWPDNLKRYFSTSTASGSNSSNTAPDHVNTFYMTNVLDTHLKANTALALSVCQVAVPHYPERACLACAVGHAKRVARKPLREGEGGQPSDRFLINLRTRLAGSHDNNSRRRILDLPAQGHKAT